MNLQLPSIAVLLGLFCTAIFGGCAIRHALPEVTTVPSVDLVHYTGLWHEVGRLPNFFQRDTDRHTTATYTSRPDGRIDVLNSTTRADGLRKQIRGIASVVPDSGNAKLRVSFFWPLAGDYWIIGLDNTGYQWAVVGHPSRNYLWFLARNPTPPEEVMEKMRQIALEQGYNLDKLILAKPFSNSP